MPGESDDITNVTSATASDTQQSSAAETQLASVRVPPYSQFVTFSLGSAIAASITSFAIADGEARGQWNSVVLIVISTVGCLLFLNVAIKASGKIRQIGGADVPLRRKKLINRCIFFAALFIGTAALVGNGIGTSGAETNRLLADIDQMTLVGDRISKARNAAAGTVPAQVEMYKSIEPEVEQLTSILSKLQAEYAIYDNKYPSQHEVTTKALQANRTGVARMELLRQQIAVAKLIESFDADSQLRMWKTRMQPILDRETALDPVK